MRRLQGESFEQVELVPQENLLPFKPVTPTTRLTFDERTTNRQSLRQQVTNKTTGLMRRIPKDEIDEAA